MPPDRDQRAERQAVAARFGCPREACDQSIACVFYCWHRPTMAALNHEREQWDR